MRREKWKSLTVVICADLFLTSKFCKVFSLRNVFLQSQSFSAGWCSWLFHITSWTQKHRMEDKQLHFTSIACADGSCPLASSKEDLELMERECIAGFEAAGLETGMDKTKHSPITDSFSEHQRPLEKLCSNSGSAMTNRNRQQKAKSMFERWSNIRFDTNPGSDKTHSLRQSVRALQPAVAERLLDPCRNVIWLLGERGSTRACSASEEVPRRTSVPSGCGCTQWDISA